MAPKTRRKVALVILVLSVVIGWPLSWVLPIVNQQLAQQVLMWISFLAISFTCLDWWSTTDVRAEQDTGNS